MTWNGSQKKGFTKPIDMEKNVIEISGLWFSYNGHTILHNIDLTVKEKEFMAVIGPNGGGKTTLLKLMLGLLKPDKGTIRILGSHPRKACHQIGYVPQEIGFDKRFPVTVFEVVLMGRLNPSRRWSKKTPRDREITEKALDRVGMLDFRDKRIGELSGGQRQRTFIARALASEPKILFLDEPTASVDSPREIEFYNLLKKLNNDITILVVSHDFFVISSYVKSVACVNGNLHYHDDSEITEEMLDMYQCCPVELVAHGGLPHRVLKKH